MADKAQLISFVGFHEGGGLEGGFLVYHYEAGTTTLKNVWTDRDKVTPAAQPVVSDAQGVAYFFADGLYKFVILNAEDTGTLATFNDWNVVDVTLAEFAEGSAIASASTLVIPAAGRWFHVTGTTGATGISGTQHYIWLIFDSVVTLTHSASLILPDGRDYRTSPNAVLMFFNEGSDVWRLGGRVHYAGGVEGRKGVDLASAATIQLGADGDYFHLTGSATVSKISTRGAGSIVHLECDATPVFTHHATDLILMEQKNNIAKAGDVLTWISEGTLKWREVARATNLEYGRYFTGPAVVGSGSTVAHESDVTIASGQQLDHLHLYRRFTLDSGITITAGLQTMALTIMAEETITINGTISRVGAGSAGGAAGAADTAGVNGGDGRSQPGGAGGGGGGSTIAVGGAGGSGGSALSHGVVANAGGAGGVGGPTSTAGGNGGANVQITGFGIWRVVERYGGVGGAGGGGGGGGGTGGGAGGAGAAGGGALILIAPKIILGASSVLNTSGSAGANGSDAGSGSLGAGGGGGGGGAGNIWIFCRELTDNGATFTQGGGGGGTGGGVGFAGGTGSPGATGVKQIMVYK